MPWQKSCLDVLAFLGSPMYNSSIATNFETYIMTTNNMDLDSIIQALAKHFGEAVVTTQESQEFIRSLGQEPNKYYLDLRTRFRAGHGKLCFADAEQMVGKFGDVPNVFVKEEVAIEPEHEIETRLNMRFNALNVMSRATACGINRAMIVSGSAGSGKSFSVERAAEEIVGDFEHIKGHIRPTGLYKKLYENRHAGSLVVFDDADGIFSDEISLNLLKAACDSSSVRSISWLSNTPLETDDGDVIPSKFIFDGSVIFITNIDFNAQIQRGSKVAPHLEALISRSHYLDLGIRTGREHMVRIKQVLNTGMLDEQLTDFDKSEIVQFMTDNLNNMRELSLRMVKKLADLMLMDRNSWKELAKVTCMK